MTVSRDFPGESSPYWIESEFDIRQVIKTLAKKSEKLSLTVRSGPHEASFLTIALDITDEGRLVMDACGERRLNEAACLNGAVAHGALERVDIDFQLDAGKMIDYDGSPALSFELPQRLHKLQRREFFRLPTPMAKPLTCSLWTTSERDPSGKAQERVATVLDISIGGMCLQEPADFPFASGEIFKACSVALPDLGALRFDLEVRHTFEIQNRAGKPSRRAGCEFVGLSAGAQQMVQRFMAKLERDRRSVLG
jgi:c-di-GMP-binding flagellar brake protein YcgR